MIEVRAGERRQVSIMVPRRVLRIRVVDQGDRPLADVPASIVLRDRVIGARGIGRTTDAWGECALDPAPNLPLVLRADPRMQIGSSEAVELDADGGSDGTPVEVTLRIRRGS